MKLRMLNNGQSSVIILATAVFACGPSDTGGRDAVSFAAPAGYYDAVDVTNGTTMRSTLHNVIDDHRRYPYTSSNIDTWNILEDADEDPNNSTRVLEIYKNASYPKFGGGNTSYSREHSWPSSYGFPNDNSGNYPYTDCHHLFLSDDNYNSTRGNKPYRTCATCNEVTTVANNGEGGPSTGYPGWSNWTSGSASSGNWETWVGRRGDVARAVLYMDVRYEGGTHGVTGHAEPDLRLTDNASLIVTGSTYMGLLTDVLRWNIDDPPSDLERNRHEVVWSYQNNRNPFVDHPEWAGCIFKSACPSTPLALSPASLVATEDDVSVDLDWADSGESMVLGFRVYRAAAAAGPFELSNPRLLTTSSWHDSGVSTGHRYWYRVVAVDAAGRESNPSSIDLWVGEAPLVEVAFINELHYDNEGTDSGERVEIAGTAGTNLEGWRIIGYNGSGGASYATVLLSGIIPAQQGCFGALSFNMAGMQNGSPDGLALVDAAGTVVEFLSYEGVFTATDGAASGRVSVDIGVAETGTTPVGYSLRRTGSGAVGSDFTFAAQAASSFGAPNASQTFTGCP